MSDDDKRRAAEAAFAEVRTGMRIGLGTGSTARHFVDLLGQRVAQGMDCLCVPTSKVTARQATELNIPLTDLDTIDRLDLTIDGADEVGPGLALIKGAGGALLREKIVASASDRMIVIADSSKRVETLGKFPLPVEVNVFGLGATRRGLLQIMARLDAGDTLKLRSGADGNPYVTDGGHFILDAFFGRISQPEALGSALRDVPGVVQHGLFLNICSRAYLAGPDGIQVIDA